MILVTGAGGTVGTALVDELRAGGDELRAAYHSPPKAEKARAQGAIYQPAGDAQISHIDVRDIARVAARVLTTGGHEAKAYELSGPQGLSYADAARILSRVLDREISYVALSDEAAKAGMLAAGMPEFYADHMLDLFRAYRTGIASQVTSHVQAVTGRAPLAFEQFARDYANAFR